MTQCNTICTKDWSLQEVSNLDLCSLFLKRGVNWPLFQIVLTYLRHKILQFIHSFHKSVIWVAQIFVVFSTSIAIRASSQKGRVGSGCISCCLPFLVFHMHGAGTWSVHTCWPITTGGMDRFFSVNKFIDRTGAMSVALHFYPFTYFVIFVHIGWNKWQSHIMQSGSGLLQA